MKSVGLEPILGHIPVVGGSGLFLTLWRSLGESLGEHVVFMKTLFLRNFSRKIGKMLYNVRQRDI